MPNSKSRHHHHPKHTSAAHRSPATMATPATGKNSNAVIAALLFLAVLGAAVGFFVGNGSLAAVVVGILIGAAGGFLIGQQIEKSAAKK